MNGSVILGKTRKGVDELAHRTGTVSQKQRSLLILIDGKTRNADLIRKCAFITQCEEHLDWLLQNGFVEALDTGPAAGSAAVASLPPAASPRKALLALAQELLGPHAGTVVQRLQDTDDTHDALVQTLDRCHKLIRLSIDEGKAEQFRKLGAALLTR